jgi:hypothetical protein
MGLRRMRPWTGSGIADSGVWRTQLQRSMWPLRVVVRAILGKHRAEVSLPEDQHSVSDFGSDGQDEAFGEAVRPRTPWRDLDHLDARIREHRVERGRELSRAIADEEPESRDVLAEVHHKVADLLGRPGPVRMCGHAQDVQGAITDLEHEQDVEPPQRHRAVDVEEVDREQPSVAAVRDGLGSETSPRPAPGSRPVMYPSTDTACALKTLVTSLLSSALDQTACGKSSSRCGS